MESMQVSDLGICEINEVPPPLDLTTQEIAALADDLVQYHAEFADLYYRAEQVHWGGKYLQGLLLPIARKSIEPLALALAGGNVQAMQQFIGQGQWQDAPLLHKHWQLAEVPHDTQVWLARPATAVPAWTGRGRRPSKVCLAPGTPAPQRVDQLAAAVSAEGWQLFLIKEGSKGPLVAEFACQRGVAVRGGLPGPEVGMILRRSLGESPDLKIYLSNAPASTPEATLVRVAGMRWPIETAFEESKGGLGLDHYEVRTWLGWHHHMTLCLLAHHFLVRARLRVKKGHQH
jgi:SRSO17 transposase